MPRLADLQKRNAIDDDFAESPLTSKEVTVSDVRSQLSPVQVVEQKLGAALLHDADFSSRENDALRRKTVKQPAARIKKPR